MTTNENTNAIETCERCDGTGWIWRGERYVSINDPCPICFPAEAESYVWGSREGEYIHPSDSYEIYGEDEF